MICVPGGQNLFGIEVVDPASLMTVETNPIKYVDILGWILCDFGEFMEPTLDGLYVVQFV
jgi:hypothetical protein